MFIIVEGLQFWKIWQGLIPDRATYIACKEALEKGQEHSFVNKLKVIHYIRCFIGWLVTGTILGLLGVF